MLEHILAAIVLAVVALASGSVDEAYVHDFDRHHTFRLLTNAGAGFGSLAAGDAACRVSVLDGVNGVPAALTTTFEQSMLITLLRNAAVRSGMFDGMESGQYIAVGVGGVFDAVLGNWTWISPSCSSASQSDQCREELAARSFDRGDAECLPARFCNWDALVVQHAQKRHPRAASRAGGVETRTLTASQTLPPPSPQLVQQNYFRSLSFGGIGHRRLAVVFKHSDFVEGSWIGDESPADARFLLTLCSYHTDAGGSADEVELPVGVAEHLRYTPETLLQRPSFDLIYDTVRRHLIFANGAMSIYFVAGHDPEGYGIHIFTPGDAGPVILLGDMIQQAQGTLAAPVIPNCNLAAGRVRPTSRLTGLVTGLSLHPSGDIYFVDALAWRRLHRDPASGLWSVTTLMGACEADLGMLTSYFDSENALTTPGWILPVATLRMALPNAAYFWQKTGDLFMSFEGIDIGTIEAADQTVMKHWLGKVTSASRYDVFPASHRVDFPRVEDFGSDIASVGWGKMQIWRDAFMFIVDKTNCGIAMVDMSSGMTRTVIQHRRANLGVSPGASCTFDPAGCFLGSRAPYAQFSEDAELESLAVSDSMNVLFFAGRFLGLFVFSWSQSWVRLLASASLTTPTAPTPVTFSGIYGLNMIENPVAVEVVHSDLYVTDLNKRFIRLGIGGSATASLSLTNTTALTDTFSATQTTSQTTSSSSTASITVVPTVSLSLSPTISATDSATPPQTSTPSISRSVSFPTRTPSTTFPTPTLSRGTQSLSPPNTASSSVTRTGATHSPSSTPTASRSRPPSLSASAAISATRGTDTLTPTSSGATESAVVTSTQRTETLTVSFHSGSVSTTRTAAPTTTFAASQTLTRGTPSASESFELIPIPRFSVVTERRLSLRALLGDGARTAAGNRSAATLSISFLGGTLPADADRNCAQSGCRVDVGRADPPDSAPWLAQLVSVRRVRCNATHLTFELGLLDDSPAPPSMPSRSVADVSASLILDESCFHGIVETGVAASASRQSRRQSSAEKVQLRRSLYHALPPSERLAARTIDVTVVDDREREPPPVPQQAVSTAKTAAAASTALSVAGGNPVVAAQANRMGMLLDLAMCNGDLDDSLDTSASITGARLGPEPKLEPYVGAMAANTLLVIGFGVLQLFVAVVWRKFKNKRFVDALGDVRFPGLLIVPAMFFNQPAVSSAVIVLNEGDLTTASLRFGAAMVLLCWAAPIVALAYFFKQRFRATRFKKIAAPYRSRGQQLSVLLFGSSKWQTTKDDALRRMPLVRLFGYLFVDFNERAPAFMIAELTVNFVAGVLDGIRPSTLPKCQTLVVCAAVLYIGYFSALLALRPYCVKATQWIMIPCAFLQAAGSVGIATFVFTQEYRALQTGTLLPLVATYVMIAKSIFDTAMSLVDVYLRIMRHLTKDPTWKLTLFDAKALRSLDELDADAEAEYASAASGGGGLGVGSGGSGDGGVLKVVTTLASQLSHSSPFDDVVPSCSTSDARASRPPSPTTPTLPLHQQQQQQQVGQIVDERRPSVFEDDFIVAAHAEMFEGAQPRGMTWNAARQEWVEAPRRQMWSPPAPAAARWPSSPASPLRETRRHHSEPRDAFSDDEFDVQASGPPAQTASPSPPRHPLAPYVGLGSRGRGIFGAGRTAEGNAVALPGSASEPSPRFDEVPLDQGRAAAERKALLEEALRSFRQSRNSHFDAAIQNAAAAPVPKLPSPAEAFAAAQALPLREQPSSASGEPVSHPLSPSLRDELDDVMRCAAAASTPAVSQKEITPSGAPEGRGGSGAVGAPQQRDVGDLENAMKAFATGASRERRDEERPSLRAVSPPVAPRAAEPVPSGPSYRARLMRFFDTYAPHKLAEVDAILLNYRGREEVMFQTLVKKYGREPDELGATALRALYRDRLLRFYTRYDPAKMPGVDKILDKYSGSEAELFAHLVERYGPEPTLPTPTVRSPVMPSAQPQQQLQSVTAKLQQPVAIPQSAPPSAADAQDEVEDPFAPDSSLVDAESAAALVAPSADTETADDDPFAPEPAPEPVVMAPPPAAPQKKAAPSPTAPPPKVAPAKKAPVVVGPPQTKAAVAATEGHRERLTRFYQRYAPSKVADIDTILATYRGREAEMYRALVLKYGPEPPAVTSTTGAEATAPAQQPHESVPPQKGPPPKAGTPPGGAATAPKSAPAGKVGPKSLAPVGLAQQPQPRPQAPSGSAAPPVAGKKAPPAPTPSKAPEEYPHRERLIRFYAKYAREKLKDVDMILGTFEGREAEMFDSLRKKYGEEPRGAMPPHLAKLYLGDSGASS